MVNISEVIKSSDYNFLSENPHLNKNICRLSLGGSYAYGMNLETSDIDIRGIALNSKEEILLSRDFEQVVDKKTDTTVYSLNRFIFLLKQNNPNIIEMIGVRDSHGISPNYSWIWDELSGMQDAFLSKRVVKTFGGYATSQLRRLENKSVRSISDRRKQEHIVNSIRMSEDNFREQFSPIGDNGIKYYVDEQDEHTADIYIDVCLNHYPLRDFAGYINGLNTVIRDYDKIGRRNKDAIEKGKIAKHSAHLIRIYFMCFDILKGNGVITYREKEHDLLMDIRLGKYLDEDNHPTKEFYKIVDDCEKLLEELKCSTKLPEIPDYKRIDAWQMKINQWIVENT